MRSPVLIRTLVLALALLPATFCILPALLIVFLGPPLLSLA